MSAVRNPTAADPFATFDAAGAWLSLPQVTRDLIGALALQMTFGAFVSQDAYEEPKLFDREQRADGLDREGSAIAAMQMTIERSLPAIFGKEGEDPEWADRGQIGRSLIEKAISIVGSEAKLGKAAGGLSQHAIWQAKKKGRVSAEMADGIERATGGRVTRAELRPDIFGDDERSNSRTDREIADAAVNGLRRVFAPASILAEAGR